MSEEKYGSSHRPKKLKCTSFGVPNATKPYLCMVFEDGQQIYAAMSFDIARLFAAQAAEIVASWPAEPKGN